MLKFYEYNDGVAFYEGDDKDDEIAFYNKYTKEVAIYNQFVCRSAEIDFKYFEFIYDTVVEYERRLRNKVKENS